MWWNRSQPCKRKGAIATIATISESVLESRILLSTINGLASARIASNEVSVAKASIDNSNITLTVSYATLPAHIVPGQRFEIGTATMVNSKAAMRQFRGLTVEGPENLVIEISFSGSVISSGTIGAGETISTDAQGKAVPKVKKNRPGALQVWGIAPALGITIVDAGIQISAGQGRFGKKTTTFTMPVTGSNPGVHPDFTSNDPPVVIPPVIDPPVIDPPVVVPPVIVNPPVVIVPPVVVNPPVVVVPPVIVNPPVVIVPPVIVNPPVVIVPPVIVNPPVVIVPPVVVPPVVVPPVYPSGGGQSGTSAFVPFALAISADSDPIRITDLSVRFVPTSVVIGTTMDIYANPLGGNFTGGSLGSGVVQANGLLDIHLSSPFTVIAGGDWELELLYYGVALQDVDSVVSIGFIKNGVQQTTTSIVGPNSGPPYYSYYVKA